ncbi:hypothetical protein FXB40_41080 [Bradyrhizobium rifense]|uniref:Uncharacterized protein n=1 Tax=Bradyrhizobium rifense TaxID=515499 RepID=A0A5D3JZ04_9BRAD|nr:hypothetical protein FXB40_41080 [Bradyrhizobium rifense]
MKAFASLACRKGDGRFRSEADFSAFLPYVGFESWLCENVKTLNRDRRSYSFKTVLVAQRASEFNLGIELKNIILRRVSIFEFLHSQGH